MLLYIPLEYFSFNFGTLLKFWGYPEVQDGGSKMATINFGNHDIIATPYITSSPAIADLF